MRRQMRWRRASVEFRRALSAAFTPLPVAKPCPCLAAPLQKYPAAVLCVGILDIPYQPVELADFRFDDVSAEALLQIPARQAQQQRGHRCREGEGGEKNFALDGKSDHGVSKGVAGEWPMSTDQAGTP